MPQLPGFAGHAVPAKPLGPFCDAWETYLNQSGPASVAIIGGGVAGAEIAMAFSHALQRKNRSAQIFLLDKHRAFTALPDRAADKLRQKVKDLGITLKEGCDISHISEGQVHLSSETLQAGFICGAAGARPQPLAKHSDLDLEDGYIRIAPDLRSSDPHVFAVGDCAFMQHAPRPKAGVYAVRQAPVLFHNLRCLLSGQGALRPYHPQKDYLKLISLGEKSALADKFGRVWSGPLMWRWKNHIDRKFMHQFSTLPQMPAPELPKMRAEGVAEVLGDKPLCGGCGSKLGQGVLQGGIGVSLGATRRDVTPLPGDDAALVTVGGQNTVTTTDHLRAMVEDPVLMTKIAAHHALGDIWAMGAKPQTALVSLILPRQSDRLATRLMAEIMASASDVMQDAGAAIVGGHSSFGNELTIGFTLTGLIETPPITLSGARPGDSLILTKPLGSGILMAAEMQKRAHGADVVAALQAMTRSQGQASALLSGAHAMTDVTGFGLIGHLRNICRASGTSAKITRNDIPTYPGALDLAKQGIRSTIHPQNRAALPDLADPPANALLFDPQTAGGLLAAVPGDGMAQLAALQTAGYQAAIIGEITDSPDQIDIR
jgi:selenide,water dikinase